MGGLALADRLDQVRMCIGTRVSIGQQRHQP